jgi:hypothetical protein
MTFFRLPGRRGRPAPQLRTRLTLSALDDRSAPSALTGSVADEPDELTLLAASMLATAATEEENAGYLSSASDANAPPLPAPPQIVNFNAEEVGYGLYRFTGQVIDPNPGGLVVTFGGVPTMVGKTATVGNDGNFSLLVQLQTDGSDTGNVSAVTQNAAGQSNVATVWVDPTP